MELLAWATWARCTPGAWVQLAGSEFCFQMISYTALSPQVAAICKSIPLLSLTPSAFVMTVSAFGSSIVRVCLVTVLVACRRRFTVHDVNSRYLTYTPLINFQLHPEFLFSVFDYWLTRFLNRFYMLRHCRLIASTSG